MIDLAWRDAVHNRGRFALTVVGIGLLLMVVMGMGGIHRGILADATVLVDSLDADLWVVQRDTTGPFAETSRIPAETVERVRTLTGVATAREFVFHTIQRFHRGRVLRIAILGTAWPDRRREWVPLVEGRMLEQPHREMLADRSLGLRLGEEVRLGKDTFRVVGLTQGLVSSGGDGVAVLSWQDAIIIQDDRPGEAIRFERRARSGRTSRAEVGRSLPEVIELAGGPAAAIPSLPSASLAAVLVNLAPGQDPSAVRSALASWADVSVHDRETECRFLLTGNVEKVERQIGLFRVLLTAISTVVLALILYTLTLDKLSSIALLKLLGAPNRVIAGMVLRQALLLGVLAFATAWFLGRTIFPRFPRRVVLASQDLWLLAGIVIAVSAIASLAGIAKALSVEAREALS